MTEGSICMMVCPLRDWTLAMGTTGLTGTKARVGATKARRIAPFMVKKLLCLLFVVVGEGARGRVDVKYRWGSGGHWRWA